MCVCVCVHYFQSYNINSHFGSLTHPMRKQIFALCPFSFSTLHLQFLLHSLFPPPPSHFPTTVVILHFSIKPCRLSSVKPRAVSRFLLTRLDFGISFFPVSPSVRSSSLYQLPTASW
jgi:hypothetical protein